VLDNHGELATTTGGGGMKTFGVNVTNEGTGVLDIGAASNSVQGGWSITNNGALDLGEAAVLDLAGAAGGPASLREAADATTGITVDAKTGSTSVIRQGACPAGATACATEAISLAGTLTVTAIGTPSGSYVPIYSEQSAVAGTFTAIPPGYGASYNEGPTAALPALVGDMVLNS
jgi:hypothetical protein